MQCLPCLPWPIRLSLATQITDAIDEHIQVFGDWSHRIARGGGGQVRQRSARSLFQEAGSNGIHGHGRAHVRLPASTAGKLRRIRADWGAVGIKMQEASTECMNHGGMYSVEEDTRSCITTARRLSVQGLRVAWCLSVSCLRHNMH